MIVLVNLMKISLLWGILIYINKEFINKELRKAISDRSRLRNRFCKTPTEENKKLYKKQRNKCVSIRKKSIKKLFQQTCK